MLKVKLIHSFNLQLFADAGASAGGEGGTGAVGAAENGILATSKNTAKNPLANIQYGVQDSAPPAEVQKETTTENDPAKPPEVDRNAEFEKLIKGDYKDLYDARMQDTIQKRLKSSKETIDKYNGLTPVLEVLAKKYGVDSNDVKALNQAIEEDNSYYEEEAVEKGLSVEQLKGIRKMEKENAELKQQMNEKTARENADKLYASWMNQADSMRNVYPSFDLNAEMQNPKFLDLVKNNVDLKTAYEVIHKDEIIPAAMQFTAQKVEQQLTNKIIANNARPAENGLSSQSSAVVKSDVSKLTKADRAEIARRVARGEKIRF